MNDEDAVRYDEMVAAVRATAFSGRTADHGRLVKAIVGLYVLTLRYGRVIRVHDTAGRDMARRVWPMVVRSCFQQPDAALLLPRARLRMRRFLVRRRNRWARALLNWRTAFVSIP